MLSFHLRHPLISTFCSPRLLRSPCPPLHFSSPFLQRHIKTASKPPPSSAPPPSKAPSTKKRRPRTPRTPRHKRWRGLDVKRLPSSLPDGSALVKLQQDALNHALLSMISNPHLPFSLDRMWTLIHSTRNYGDCKKLFPNDEVVSEMIERIVEAADRDATVRMLGAGGADVSCEAFFRSMEVMGVSPGVGMLQAVLRGAARDPVVERRGERAMAVFRYLRGRQMRPSPGFVFECFRVCIRGLDVEMGACLMDFAVNHGFCVKDEEEGIGKRRDYLNGVMYAGLLVGDLNTVGAAYGEMRGLGIVENGLTESVLVGICLKNGDEEGAMRLFERVRGRGGGDAGCGYAGWIGVKGMRGKVGEVIRLVREYVECREKGGRGLFEERGEGIVGGEVSSRAGMLRGGDPLWAGFVGLRRCGAGEEAIELLEELVDRIGYKGSWKIRGMIMEACMKGGRMDLAKEERLKMENAQKEYTERIGKGLSVGMGGVGT